MSKIFETTRGRPVAIEAVPQFCPICGYELAGADYRHLPSDVVDERVRAHAELQHPERLGQLYALVRGAPAARVRVLVVTMPLGVDHGPDPIDVILLDPIEALPQYAVETFDLKPLTGHSHPRYRLELDVTT